MPDLPIARLLGLGLVLLVAISAVLLLLRQGSRAQPDASIALIGYPPERYPATHLTRTGALADLASTQARLAAITLQLSFQSELAIWMRSLLGELRQILDTAYRVAVITELYGQPPQIERLAAQVQQIESQVAAHVTERLLAQDADAQAELLEARLAALRMYARELAKLPAGGAWAADQRYSKEL